MRKIVEWLVGGELAERGLFQRQSLAGHFVGVVGGGPQLPAQRDGIVVERRKVATPDAGAVVAVLLVIAHAHDHAHGARVDALSWRSAPKAASASYSSTSERRYSM